MAKRNDIHRPGAIIASNYDFVIAYALPSTQDGFPVPGINLDQVQALMDGCKFAATGGLGKCSVCGANFIYGDVWLHEGSEEHIHLGQDCAYKYGLQARHGEFEIQLERARRTAGITAARARNSAERLRFLAQHPGLDAALETDHRIVRDIGERFIQYKSLSDKQIALVFKLAGETRDRQLHEANHDEAVEGCTFCERESKQSYVSQHVGVVGERTQLNLKQILVREIAGGYGWTYLHIFEDAAGNTLKWFGSSRLWKGNDMNAQANRLADGESMVVVATIKAHDEYQGKKQTVLARVQAFVPKAPKPKKNKANSQIAEAIVQAFSGFEK